jgi:hypothetical protein
VAASQRGCEFNVSKLTGICCFQRLHERNKYTSATMHYVNWWFEYVVDIFYDNKFISGIGSTTAGSDKGQ